MAKTIRVTLRDTGDGEHLAIESFSNTCELVCGQIVTRSEDLARWDSKKYVYYTVKPPLPAKEDGLMEDVETIAVGSVSNLSANDEAGRVCGADFESGVQADARMFDQIMIENSIERGWATQYQFADASLPDPGNDHLGTAAIKGKIARHEALSAVRRNCVRDLDGDFENAGAVAVRAALLGKLKDLVSVPLPF
jgi:hypothetical protein